MTDIVTTQVGPWAMVPGWVLTMGLKGAEIAVYVSLRTFADRGGEAHPKVKTIAERAGVSERTTERALARFRALGMMRSEQWYRPDGSVGGCRYHMRDIPPSDNGSPPPDGDVATPPTQVSPPPDAGVGARTPQGFTPKEHPPYPHADRAPSARVRKTRGGRSIKDQGPEGTDGHEAHAHHGNAQAWCSRVIHERRLPLPIGELLGWCYRAGQGDPWEGHYLVDRETSKELDTARDPVSVLRSRLKAVTV